MDDFTLVSKVQKDVSDYLDDCGIKNAGVGMTTTESGLAVEVQLTNSLSDELRAELQNISVDVPILIEQTGDAFAYAGVYANNNI